MNSVWEIAALAGWAVLLLNLALTLRLARWIRSYQEAERLGVVRADVPELPVGEPAPPFRARDLSGRVVRSEELAGREVALVFVSPHCGTCRRELPGLMKLASVAKERTGAEIILVSAAGVGETESWVASLRENDKLELTTPLLQASEKTSDFLTLYNPRLLTPYFCHIDRSGNVTARGGLGSPAWAAVVQKWDATGNPGWSLRRYG
jgi:peroxiredoxin